MGQVQTRTSQDGRRMKTILIVEDDYDSRTMLKLLLESENYSVLEATTGPEGLKIAKLRNPDLILMDLGLPGFDGLETMRRIRQIDWLQKTPIVVLSAYSGPAYYQAAIDAGGAYFIPKPIDFDNLQAAMRRLERSRIFQHRQSDRTTRPAFKYVPRENQPARLTN
jgi:CheY-like chemotaxis protein